MTTALAIDCSNYTGPITPQQAADLHAAGVRKAIVQIVNPTILVHRDQIPALLGAGIEVEVYVYVWFPDVAFASGRVAWACAEAAAWPSIKMVWLDCEQSNGDTPPFDYVHAATSPTIRACVAAVETAGMSPGIYTAAWWWIPGTTNSREWAHLPLWNANYDLDPDLDPVDYGGWTVPRMEQYAGTSTLAGVTMIDLDTYDPGNAAPPVLDKDTHLAALVSAHFLNGQPYNGTYGRVPVLIGPEDGGRAYKLWVK